MILLYQTLEQINGTGIIGIFQTASASINMGPITLPLLIMMALFIIITFASYFSTQRRYGRGDFPASASVAGFVVCIVGALFSMIPSFMPSNIALNPLTYFVVLEIIFAYWLMSSKE